MTSWCLGFKNDENGMTLVEMIIAMAAASVLIVAVTAFAARLLVPPRHQFERGLTNIDAQVEMERMSDVIRDAVSEGGSLWIINASNSSITVNSDINDDGTLEVVNYFLNGNELQRTVDGVTETLTNNVVNNNAQYRVNLFSYYSIAPGGTVGVSDRGLPISPSGSNLTSIDRVVITLYIDNDENQLPEALKLETVVTPRKGG